MHCQIRQIDRAVGIGREPPAQVRPDHATEDGRQGFRAEPRADIVRKPFLRLAGGQFRDPERKFTPGHYRT